MDIKYFNEITEAAERYNLDPLMVASVVRAESNFKSTAESWCHAKGLMQLMAPTYKDMDGKDDIFDVKNNLDAGCKYLDYLKKYIIKKYPILLNGNRIVLWKLIWACYNAGMGNINKMLKLSLKEKGDAGYDFDIWKDHLQKITGNHSKETIGYVAKIEKFWKEYVEQKEKANSSDPGGSMIVSRKRLSCLLTMINSMKKEVEQLLEEADLG